MVRDGAPTSNAFGDLPMQGGLHGEARKPRKRPARRWYWKLLEQHIVSRCFHHPAMSEAELPPPYLLGNEWNPDSSTVQHRQSPPLRTPSASRPNLRLGPDSGLDRSPGSGPGPSPSPSLAVTLLAPNLTTTLSLSRSDLVLGRRILRGHWLLWHRSLPS